MMEIDHVIRSNANVSSLRKFEVSQSELISSSSTHSSIWYAFSVYYLSSFELEHEKQNKAL